MKKILSLVIMLFGIFLIYQFTVTRFKSSHDVSYTIEHDSVSFQVNEKYDNGAYYFKVTQGDFSYIFSKENVFNKRTEVLEDIEFMNQEGFSCIYPIYEKKEESTVYCSDTENIYSYESVKSRSDVIQFISSLKEKEYTSNSWITPEYQTISDQKITAFYDYMDEAIGVWNYNGVTVFENKMSFNQDVLNFDRYENTLATLVGRYYVMPLYINNNLFESTSFGVLDLKTNNYFTIPIGFTLSNQSYINGIIDNKLYIFDKSNKTQIEINPKKKTIEVVGDLEKNAKYYNNGWETRNIYDFINQDLKFQTMNLEPVKDLTYDSIYETKDSYFLYQNQTMYQFYKNDMTKKITLFQVNNIKEIQVLGNDIYYIEKDTLYRYRPYEGIRKLLTYSELQYNYKNMIHIYK